MQTQPHAPTILSPLLASSSCATLSGSLLRDVPRDTLLGVLVLVGAFP
jgi:hypothetical protein